MDAKRSIFICDNDSNEVNRIKQAFEEQGYYVEVIDDASQLVPRVQQRGQGVVIANPDLQGFNEYDVCKKIIKELGLPLLFILDKTSTVRAQVDECNPDDVVTKPVELNNLINLVDKHVTITANTSR